MSTDRAFIRHEILNIVTILNFMVAEAKIKPKARSEILQNLKMIGLLTAQTEFILGNKKKFSKVEIPLAEIIEITEAVLSDHLKKAKMKLKLPKTRLIIKGDRDVIMGGLEHILLYLMPATSNVDMHVDKKNKKLHLKYDSDQVLKPSNQSLLEVLRKANDPLEVFFEIHVQLMQKSGVKTNFKKGHIELTFK